MKWMRFRIRTNEESEDIIVSSMTDIGLEGAQIEDNAPLTAADKEQMFVDDAPELQPDNLPDIEAGVAYLSFFVEIDDDNNLTVEEYDENGELQKIKRTPEEMKNNIREVLDELKTFSDIGDGTISVDVTEDIDWINNWKQYFHKFFVDDVLVIPSWEKVSDEDAAKAKMILHIDPGTAFGTGSGVLSILSIMFGADSAVGTDLDPCCIPATQENLESNNIDKDKYNLIIGNIIDDKKVQDEVGYEQYDIVVANILANVLVPLSPEVNSHLKKGGVYITSGIIDTKEEEVKKAHEDAGFEIQEIHHQGDWVSITSIKK